MLPQSRVFQMLQVHLEMYHVMYAPGRRHQLRGLFPAQVPIDPQRLMQLWDYEGSLTAKVSGILQ